MALLNRLAALILILALFVVVFAIWCMDLRPKPGDLGMYPHT